MHRRRRFDDRVNRLALCRLEEVWAHRTNEDRAEDDAYEHDIELRVVKPSEAKKGFVLLPKRRVVERSFAWLNRFRRLARDYERLTTTLAGLHVVAFVCLMVQRLFNILSQSA